MSGAQSTYVLRCDAYDGLIAARIQFAHRADGQFRGHPVIGLVLVPSLGSHVLNSETSFTDERPHA